MNRLTTRQQAIYDFIRECMISRGYGPTVREIGLQMDIKSPNGVMCHLRALEKKGVIHRSANKSRAIELAEPLQRADATLPIHGWLEKGSVREPSGTSLQLDLIQSIGGEQNFLIDVIDESLDILGFYPGDKVVIRRFGAITPGQLVLASLSTSNDQFIARVALGENGLRVEPMGTAFKPMPVRDVDMVGIAIGLIRIFPASKVPL